MIDVAAVFADPVATELDRLRQQRRQGKAITYDCRNAAVIPGLKVSCRKGKNLNANARDQAVNLVAILRGYTSGACRGCPFYEGGDPE